MHFLNKSVNASDEASPHYTFLVGSVLVLHKDVYIRPSYARVYFQNGEAGAAVNEFDPHCQLEVRQVLPTVQTVKPDRFVVKKVSYDTLDMAVLPGVMVAQGGGGDGGVSDIMEAWKFRLYSERQPNVLQMICAGGIDTPFRARPPSRLQIRQALGSYASFKNSGDSILNSNFRN